MIQRIKAFFQGRSREWPKFRRAFLKKNFCCEACLTEKKLEVHHITPFHLAPKLELKESNCITLCKRCHLVFGHFSDYSLYNPLVVLDARKYMFDRMEAKRRNSK